MRGAHDAVICRNELFSEIPLFVYDISCNKERNHVNKTLHGFGFRVQKSVYECHLTRGDKKRLVQRLQDLNITTGHIRCYSVSTSNVTMIGALPDDDDFDDGHIYFID